MDFLSDSLSLGPVSFAVNKHAEPNAYWCEILHGLLYLCPRVAYTYNLKSPFLVSVACSLRSTCYTIRTISDT